MAAKILANLIVMGSGILGRALLQAYRQALQNASKSGAAQEAFQSYKVSSRKIMTEQEARTILGVTENTTWEEILKKYDSLFENNAKNGSFYLQSKVHRAKECLEAMYQRQSPDTAGLQDSNCKLYMVELDWTTSASTAFTSGFPSHDVFLNFRGEDTRKNFTALLHLFLKDRGIDVFIDNKSLWNGEAIGPALHKAIQGSKISIPVFSKGYAYSKWCLLELSQIVQCHKSNGQMIFPIFFFVDPSHVRNQTGSFEKAFQDHEKNFKPGIVESWRDALRMVGNLKGEVIDKNKDQAEVVELVVKRVLDKLLSSTHLAECKYPIGINSSVKDLISLLNIGSYDVQYIGICGFGGIGKTTVAKVVYNRILSNFDRHSFISDVSKQAMQCMGLASLQKRLLKDIFKRDFDIGDYHRGKKLIEQKLWKENVLLVLDDVDSKEQVEALAGELNWFGPGSRVIITTRAEHILNVAKVDKDKIYWPQELDHKESLQLFSLYAFSMKQPPEDYMELSRDVVRYSEGLPLTLEVLGSYLSDISSKEVWKTTLQELNAGITSVSSLVSLHMQRQNICLIKDNPFCCYPSFHVNTPLMENTVQPEREHMSYGNQTFAWASKSTHTSNGNRTSVSMCTSTHSSNGNQSFVRVFKSTQTSYEDRTSVRVSKTTHTSHGNKTLARGSNSSEGYLNTSGFTPTVRVRKREKIKAKIQVALSKITRGYLNVNGSTTTDRVGKQFKMAEIRAATKNFHESLVVGRGGFGIVYKGVIGDGNLAAFKLANPECLEEWGTEIEMLSKLRHRHVISMIGFCEKKNQKVMVIEYMEKGNLQDHLFGTDLPPLTWKQRLQICIDVARGLDYLHRWAESGIIHRDVKTSNILLDKNFEAKLADFGSSITGLQIDHTPVGTVVVGTKGYIDPEYLLRRQPTVNSDVYSFGVLLFEVVCARPAYNEFLPQAQKYLANWALGCQRKRSLEAIVDRRLEGNYCPESLMKFGEIAEKCLANEGKKRPTMGEV